jgi:hypothetical protein
MGYKRFGPPAQVAAGIEADMQRVAAAREEDLDVLPVSGDNPAQQEKALRAYLKQHPDADVEGFSAGGYTARRVEKDFPKAHFTKLGIGPGGSDPRFPKTSHMKLPHAEAEQAEAEKKERDSKVKVAKEADDKARKEIEDKPIRPSVEAPRVPSLARQMAARHRAQRQQDHWTSNANHRYSHHGANADVGTGTP